ncbi:MAG: hypothetical protein JWL77_3449 [Chthonomonadaceae bacterium]|nr:hypothetical protein [Chthonomonadaceae bacterium]
MSLRGRRTSQDRSIDKRPQIPSILIICEGERTEPEYFLQFKVTKDVSGLAMNTLSLVKETIAIRRSKGGTNFEQVWCVFDLDSFSKQNFDDAIRLAQQNNIKTAYSNESFELWYVLHFDYLQAQVDRKQYMTILDSRLGRKYRKKDMAMYDLLLTRQPQAIANAQRLLEVHHQQHLSHSEKKPSTTVHELVQELNKYVK